MNQKFRSMKNLAGMAAVLSAGILAVSCSGAGNATGFDNPIAVQADSIAVDQIIKPSQWAMCNGKAVVVSESTDSVFYVYSLPDFGFLYAWGHRGGGPGEFPNYVRFVDSADGDTGSLTLENYRGKTFDAFEAGDREMTLKKTSSTFPDQTTFLESRPLPSGWLTTKRVSGGKEYLYTRSPKDGSVRDSVMLYTLVKAEYDDKGNMRSLSRMNSPRIVARNDRVAVVYQNVVRVDFYRVSAEGKLELLKAVGEPLDEAVLERLRTMRSESRQNGIMGYFSTGKYLYTLYLDLELDWETKYANILEKIVYVYDWDGRQVRAFDLEKPATDILVSGDDRLLYARNLQEDFDKVYVYNLEQ